MWTEWRFVALSVDERSSNKGLGLPMYAFKLIPHLLFLDLCKNDITQCLLLVGLKVGRHESVQRSLILRR